MAELQILADVEDLGKVVQVYGDFSIELAQLKAGNAKLITPRNEAYARLQTREKENIGKTEGTRTTGGFEYALGRMPIFRTISRLTNLRTARKAVQANQAGNYFTTPSTKEFEDSAAIAEKEVKDGVEPEDRSVIFLPSRDNFKMSDRENWETYQAILKDQAKPYFELNGPINVYPVDKGVVDSQKGTLLTPLWFGSLGSGFLGGRGLGSGGGARGVCRSAEGTSQKSSGAKLVYTPQELRNQIATVQRIRAGRTNIRDIDSQLEQVVDFLLRLKK